MRLLVLTLPFCTSANATVQGNDPASTPGLGELGQMLGSLALVVVAILVVSTLLRRFRFGRQASDNNLQVISTLNIGPKERLVLLRAGEEQVLVGVSNSGMQRLHTLKKPILTSAVERPTKAFGSTLKSVYAKVQNET